MLELYNGIDVLPLVICAGKHERKDCNKCDQSPICHNCLQISGTKDSANHSAADTKRCPIFGRKIKYIIANINYE